jgi:hypothetical protein
VPREREITQQPTAAPGPGVAPAVLPDVMSVAGVLALQQTAGNVAVGAVLRRAALARNVGWTGVDPKSWNAGPQEVKGGKGVKRIPVEGLKQGHRSKGGKQDDAGEKVDDPETGKWSPVGTQTPESAGADSGGRAVVLIPNGLPDTAGTVEVLVHLHGFTPGLRGRGTDGTGMPEDVSVAKIAQQLEASGRPMIAVMPQGTKSAGPWADPTKIDLNQYIDDALALVPADQWPGKKPRARGSIVLSAHSGGGDVIAFMLRNRRMPAGVTGMFLFDALHGWGPGEIASFLTARLDSELAQLHGIWTAKTGSATPDAIAAEQVAWLQQSGFRFRGFSSAGYAQIYKNVFKPLLAAWFTGHAEQLGGAGSSVFLMLSANYLDQAAVPAGPKHEPVVGQHLLESLSQLRGGKAPDLSRADKVPAMPPAKKAPAKLSREVGWAGAGKDSPNRAPRTTAGTSIKRVPIRGVASGRDGGNALVLIPQWLPAVKTVEVLFHLHGHKWPGYGFGYGTGQDETVYRFEQALDQFAQSKRPIIAVLPQGGPRSEFGTGKTGELDADAYIQQALTAVPVDQWPGGAAPAAGGVILSGHSGAGGRFADMFDTAKMPSRLEGFFSFDTINGRDGQRVSEIVKGNEYNKHVAFILGKLDADLRMLAAERKTAAGKKEEEIQKALEGKLVRDGFRFHAYYTGTPSVRPDGTFDVDAKAVYADRYVMLKGHVDGWFAKHAAELGGTTSKAYLALRANYTIEPAGTEHMQMMGGLPGAKDKPRQHQNLRSSLGGLPTTPQGGS